MTTVFTVDWGSFVAGMIATIGVMFALLGVWYFFGRPY